MEESIQATTRKGDEARQEDSKRFKQAIEPYLGNSDAIFKVCWARPWRPDWHTYNIFTFKLLDIKPHEIPEAKIVVQKVRI